VQINHFPLLTRLKAASSPKQQNPEEDEVVADDVEEDDNEDEDEEVVVSVEEDDDDGVVEDREVDDEGDYLPSYEEDHEPMVLDHRNISRNQPVADVSHSTQRHPMFKHCGFCDKRFGREQFDYHSRYNDSGCAVHRICFPSRYNHHHAQDERHERCFVPGCESPLTRSGEWSDRDMVDHVYREHRLRSDP